MRGITIVSAAVALMLAAAVPPFEPPPTFQASKILPPTSSRARTTRFRKR